MQLGKCILCLAVTFLLLGCYSVSVRPLYQRYEAQFEVDTKILGVKKNNVDMDMEFKTAGIQVAFMPDEFVEFFVEALANHVDSNEMGMDLDEGGEVAFGIRAPQPFEPGWALDWGSRISFHGFDEDNKVSGIKVKQELYGEGAEINVGAHYAIDVGGDYFLSPHAGGLYRYVEGEAKTKLSGTKVGDYDYELEAVGAYAGFKVNSPTSESLELFVNFYTGTEDLDGFLIALGWRF